MTPTSADIRAERVVVGWLLACSDLGASSDWQLAADITPEHFVADAQARRVFETARDLHAKGKHVGVESVMDVLFGSISFPDLNRLTDEAPTSAYFADSLASLRLCHHKRRLHAAAQAVLYRCNATTGEGVEEAVAELVQVAQDRGNESLRSRMASRRFSHAERPPEPLPRFSIGTTGICTPGNLTAISAAVKSGKSSFIGAMIAAAVTPEPDRADCLGVTASNPDGKALIHLDTEQSIADHWGMIDRALRRGDIEEPPAWLRSYCITGFSLSDARSALRLALEGGRHECGGVFAVMLDGVADLVADVNDPEECNGFVSELHGIAIEFDCPIIGVIHLNPGTDKTRGHLGSQLERKAETNLRLEKEGDITVVWSDKNRRGPIPRDQGPRFQWSRDAHMHVTTASIGATKADRKRAELREVAEGILQVSGKQELPYSEFLAAIAKAEGIPAATARHRFDALKKARAIGKTGFGTWGLAA